MERGEGKIPAVEPNVSHCISGRDTETSKDARQSLEHGSNLNGLIRERSEELFGAEKMVTGLPYRSGKMKRSARASSNLRKSLAWDKAFSTDEGVLDVDELPLVTKTPRKPLELHPLDIPEILGKVSLAPLSVLESYNSNARAVDRGEMISSSPVQSSLRGSPKSPTSETGSSKGSSLVVALSNADSITSKLDNKASTSGSEIVEAGAMKGTQLRLPSTITGKRGKGDMLSNPVSVTHFLRRCKSSSSILSPSSASSAFSKKVSSVSKKVKDTLGKVLPGSLGGSTKTGNRDRLFNQFQAVKIPSSIRPASVVRSTSCKVSLSGDFLDSNTNIKKTDAKVEMSTRIPADQLGHGTIVLGLTVSSIGNDAGSSFKKRTDNRSYYSTQVSPVISRGKLGPEGSQSHPVENSDHVHAAQSSRGLSSGLRLPSPKIGLFDTPRSACGEHPSTLPERVLGSASDTSKWINLRKGLPPRPRHRLPSGRAEKLGGDGAKVSCKLGHSGIPSAPHLRPDGLVRSASAPTAPHRPYHGIRASASDQALTGFRLSSQTNSDQFQGSVSELRTRALRNAVPGTFPNFILESRDCGSGQSPNLMEDAQTQAVGKPSKRSSAGYKHDVKYGNLCDDKSSSELANVAVGSTMPPSEQYLSRSLQVIEKSGSYNTLPSVVDDVSRATENVFCRYKERSPGDAIGELTISSSIKPLVGSVCHRIPRAMLDGILCQEFERAGSAQPAGATEFDSCLGKEILDKSVGYGAEEKALGSWKASAGMANTYFGRRSGHDSRLKNDHETEDSSQFCKAVSDGVHCCANGKPILEDSPKVTTCGKKELSRNVQEIEGSKIMSSGKFGTEERAQELSSVSPVRHPEKEYKERNNDSYLDSPPTWSDSSLLAAMNTLSFQPSLGREHSPTTAPTCKRLPHTRNITAENSEKNTTVNFLRCSSPASASGGQGSRHPLAVNAGVMNGISKRTSLIPPRKERTLHMKFEPAASETPSGQENKKGPVGLVVGTRLHKPKQRKPNSSRLEQSEVSVDLFSEERMRALEAAGQESLQKKSGAVQHSPPNKTSPSRNPWSPVKKGGQQPGPFDCTKKYTNACMGQ